MRILRSLAQHSCYFGPLRSLSWWRGANLSNFAIARATRSSLWASQIALVVARCNAIAPAIFSSLWIWASEIALVVARCEFCDRSRNTLATLGLSDRSRGIEFCDRSRNALVTLKWACQIASLWRGAQLSWHFGRARSLSLGRCADFAIYRTCQGDLVPRRRLIKILYTDPL